MTMTTKTTSGAAADNFQDVMVIWELRGDYPDIPHFEGVDIAELTKGDDDPTFITLPIGKVNSKSGNNRYYDESWIKELERQAIEQRPVGIMGHIKESEIDTAFPSEAVHWVGIKRVNEMLWGKAYVTPGPDRDRIRRYKATNKPLSTSIFAHAQGVWDKALGAYRMVAETMRLHQIDIGPVDRVGIPSLGRVPLLTAEMQSNENEDTQMDKLQVINEMTAEDARLLPKPVQDAILATVQPAPEVALVTELRGALGVDGKADVVKLVTELKEETEKAAKTAVSNHITELVEDKDTGIKVESMRGLVTELVTARNPQTKEEAEQAYKLVTEMESVKVSLQAAVNGVMGPKMTTPAQPQNGTPIYFNIPKAKEEGRA